MKHGRLRTGQIIRHKATNKTGVVIDWGLGNVRFLNYLPLPAYNKTADSVRVSTSSGKLIEVWPLAAVATEEAG